MNQSGQTSWEFPRGSLVFQERRLTGDLTEGSAVTPLSLPFRQDEKTHERSAMTYVYAAHQHNSIKVRTKESPA